MHLLGREYKVAYCKYEKINVKEFNYEFTVIPNSKKYWAADPFPIEVDGKLYIFAELLEYQSGKGVIGYCMKTNKSFSKWKPIIREQYHLSFPNIFYIDKELYMCAETNESNTIYFYKCEKFPNVWIKEDTILLKGKYVDTIFLEQDGFVYGITYNLTTKKMEIFIINGKKAQLSNGIINSIGDEFDRPAGKVFFDDYAHEFILPGQIGIPKYGSGLVFKKYSMKWPDFDEENYSVVLPKDIRVNDNRKFDGVHTFNISENYIVIDLIWTRFSIRETVFKIIRKFKFIKSFLYNIK